MTNRCCWAFNVMKVSWVYGLAIATPEIVSFLYLRLHPILLSCCRRAGDAKQIFFRLALNRLTAHSGLPESLIQHSLPLEGTTEGSHYYAQPRPGVLDRLTRC